MSSSKLRMGIAQKRQILVFVVIAVSLTSGGFWYYYQQSKAIYDQNHEMLATIARMKVGQITQWRKERLSNARRAATGPNLRRQTVALLNGSITPAIREELRKIIEVTRQEGPYTEVFLVDRNGKFLFSTRDEVAPPFLPPTQRALAAVFASRQPVMSDFFREPEGHIHLDAIAIVEDDAKNIVGALILRCNAEDYLYPLIQSWPTPSATAETLLVRRDGNDVLFLNELRHHSNTALNLRQPLTQTDLLAVQAVLGRRGSFSGRDYRNKEVWADLCPVPGTAWFMVAKVDRDEILVEARYRAFSTGMIVGSLILLAAAAITAVHKQRQAGLLRDLLEAQRRALEAQEQFRTILYSIGDAVITTDNQGLVRTMNAVAERLTGWQEKEAGGVPLGEIFQIINHDTRAPVDNPVNTVLREGIIVGLANHTVLISRDGTEHAIADSAAPIRDTNGEISGVVLVVSDVTEPYKVREALSRREREYRMLFTGMLEGFASHEIICDDSGQPVDYRYLSINPAFEQMTGMQAADVIGRTLLEVMPNAEKCWVERYGAVALTGEPMHFEEYSHVLGRHFKITAFRPQTGQFATIFTDITGSRAASARIARLTQLYSVLSHCNQAIVHSSSIEELLPKICRDVVEHGGMMMAWIAWVDETTQRVFPKVAYGPGIEYLNQIEISVDPGMPTGCGPTGSAIRENRPFWSQDFQNDPASTPWHERAAKHGWASAAALPLCLRGKPVATLTLYSDKLNAFDGEVQKLLAGMANDISFAFESFAREEDRQQAEAALREKEKDYRTLIENLSAGVVVHAADTAILLTNPMASNLLGLTDNQLCGKTAMDPAWCFLKEDGTPTPLPEYPVNRVLTSGEPIKSQVIGIRKPGLNEPTWVLCNAYPIRDADDRLLQIVVTFIDITERKQMEEKLLRTQRMESIGTLASGVAHDLNNILTPIILSADVLRSTSEPEARERLISSIEECAQRGASVVNQVLTFARGVKGERTTLQLKYIVDDMEKIARETFPKNIQIQNAVPSDLCPVKGDPTQIHQVLLNLCINARDVMPEGGKLLLSGENAEIDENFAAMAPDAKTGEYAMLGISDTGTGIPRQIISKIFDPFFTTKEVGKGTGLGLSTVLGIVRSHGGFLTVESEEGSGTTFKVFLPVEIGEASEKRNVSHLEMPTGGGETILVVDDESAIAKATSLVLLRNGYKVLVANDGSEALAIFTEHQGKISLVLTDVIMPDMDGVKLTRALKQLDPQLPIIASTGQATEAVQAELRALGVSVILRKPYDARKLLVTLHDAIHI